MFILSLRVPVNKVRIRDVKCINEHVSPRNSVEVYHGTRGITSTLENVNQIIKLYKKDLKYLH